MVYVTLLICHFDTPNVALKPKRLPISALRCAFKLENRYKVNVAQGSWPEILEYRVPKYQCFENGYFERSLKTEMDESKLRSVTIQMGHYRTYVARCYW